MPVKIRPKNAGNSYWREREQIQADKNRKNADRYKKDIESIYRRCLWDTQKEIDSFYQKYADDNGLTLAEAKKKISRTDARQWREISENWKKNPHSKAAKQAFELVDTTAKINRLELLKAKIGMKMIDHHEEMEHFFGENLSHETLQEIERQAGIFGEFIGANPSKRVERIAYASFHHATWSDRIWSYQDVLRNELNKNLTQALIIGLNPRDKRFIDSLTKTFNTTQYNAERLMRTEMARVQSDVQKDSFERMGYEEYEFICCGGGSGKNPNDPCDACKALDGKIFKVKDMMPGVNAAPIHPNCHCSVAAHFSE